MKLTTKLSYAAALLLLAGCAKNDVKITADDATASAGPKLQTEATGTHVTHLSLFKYTNSGQTAYHSYFAPSIVYCSNTSTIVAFAEGRIGSGDDGSPSNIVSQRSFDNGVTWASFQTIIGTGSQAIINPTAVYDPTHGGTEGRIWLFCNYADHTVHAFYNDHSAAPSTSWTEVSNTNMYTSGSSLNGVGPGTGIILRSNANTIIIPAENRNIISTDGGSTWQQYATNSGHRTTEATIFEGEDSKLHRNDRASSAGTGLWDDAVASTHYRNVTTSSNTTTSATWTTEAIDTHLPDPKCEGSIVHYSSGNVVFCNSANGSSREYMKVRVSTYDGSTWSAGQYLYSAGAAGKGGYSSMTRVGDFSIGLLCNIETSSHFVVDFHRIDLPWINQ